MAFVYLKNQKKLDKKMLDLGIDLYQIREIYCKNSGPGGQKVNKSNNFVTLHYLDIQIQVGTHRERELNRYEARKKLIEIISAQKDIPTKKTHKIAKLIKNKKKRKSRYKKKMNKIEEKK